MPGRGRDEKDVNVKSAKRTQAARAAWLISLVMLGAACGGGGELALFAGAEEVRVGAGEAREVALTLTRFQVDKAEVTLSVSGLPAGVTATLTPAALVDGEGSSTLLLTAAADAPRGQATVTITANSGKPTASATLEVAVLGPTITGQVQGFFGEPLPGTTVLVSGATPRLVGADGRFEVEDATIPYDLTVVRAGSSDAHRFEGLTTRTPAVRPFWGGSPDVGSPRTVGFEAPVTPWAMSLPGDRVATSLEGLERPLRMAGTGQNWATGSVNGWAMFEDDGAAQQARLHVFRTNFDALQVRTTITGYASATIEVAPGDRLTLDPMPIAPLALTATLTPSLELPPGAAVEQACVYTVRPHHRGLVYCQQGLGASLDAPVFGEATIDLELTVKHGDVSLYAWARDAQAGTPTQIPLAQGPLQTVPADGAILDRNTEPVFEVENPTRRPVVFYFSEQQGPYREFWVTTTASSARFPDLSELGLEKVSDSAFTWQVASSTAVTTMDQAATDGGLWHHVRTQELSKSSHLPFPLESGTITESPRRTITLGNP